MITTSVSREGVLINPSLPPTSFYLTALGFDVYLIYVPQCINCNTVSSFFTTPNSLKQTGLTRLNNRSPLGPMTWSDSGSAVPSAKNSSKCSISCGVEFECFYYHCVDKHMTL